ncbi:carbohydrate-binding module family 12 protein [Atractiella rhizophila]|nr:carbohydrate-binding module family 12 protein [Atractiella rhizophila]
MNEPGTQYNYGDVVEYEGHRYKIIQPHRSQGDWTPPVTPALWGRLQEGDHEGGGGHHGGDQHHGGEQRPPAYGGGGQYGSHGPPQGQGGQHPFQGGEKPHDQPHDDKKDEGFWTDERKKQFGIAGGILAERAKAEEWRKSASEDAYHQNMQARCGELKKDNRGMEVYWIMAEHGEIPHNAIPIGRERDGKPLFAARGYYKGGVHPGKCGRHLRKGANISYGGDEVHLENYEVLVGNEHKIRWQSEEGRITVNDWEQGLQPVEGGRESDGRFLFLCICEHEGGIHPGKIDKQSDHANFAYDGKERQCKRYRVATYAP